MKRVFVALAGLAFAASAMAQLSKYKDWDRTPEAYFLTPAEREEWKKVASDADAEKFIVIYYAKRGGDQFREGIKRRVAAADEQFKMRRQKGSESARGRVFIVLGNPSKVQQSRGATDVSATADTGLTTPDLQSQAQAKPQIWIYEKAKFDPSWGIDEMTIHFNIDDARGSDEIAGARDQATVDKAIATVASKSIVNPNATGATASAPAAGAPAAGAAPSSGAAAPAAPAGGAAPAPAAAAPAAIVPLPAAVKTALTGATPGPAGEMGFWSGSFRSSAGDEFLALQFYLPANKSANAGGAPLKIAGVVTDASGAEVQSFWEDATFSEIAEGTRKDRVADKSVSLPPGTYKGTFGLFPAEGQPPVASSTVNFTLNPKSTEFEVSPLILSSGLVPLTKRPGPYDPFVFGTDKPIRVDPKGDRSFTKQDSLWYFYEVSNPTLPAAAPAAAPAAPAPGADGAAAAPAPAADAPKPRVMTRINVQRDGQDAFAPFTGPADLMPVTAGGQYGTGSEIPLASFEPGYYTFAIRVWDLNAPAGSAAKKGYERKEEFIVLMPDGSMPPKKAAAPPAPPKKKS